MANLNKIVTLTTAQYNTLVNNGSVTSNGVTVTYDTNSLYLTTDDSTAGVSLTS